MALNSGIQTYQILTNDDEVCIPSLSSILLAVTVSQAGELVPFRQSGNVHCINSHFAISPVAGATATVGNLITNLSSAILVFATATEFCNVDKIVQRSSLRHSILSLSRPKERKIHNLINTASLGKGCLNQRGEQNPKSRIAHNFR